MGAFSHWVAATAVITTLLAGCSGDDGGACDDLRSALANADSGDTVRMGACRLERVSVDVPAGVTLRGVGADSVLAGDDVVVRLGNMARLQNVTIESSTVGGVESEAQSVVIEDVEVRAALGFGIRLTGDGSALSRVTLVGPVTEMNANSIPPYPEPTETATHGLVLSGAGTTTAPVTLDDVSIRGFGRFGALLRDSVVEWQGGVVESNLTTGVMVFGGEATIGGLDIRDTHQGVQPLPAYGAVFAGNATVTTNGLMLADNDGLGMLADQATTAHADLSALDNGDAAVWAQRSPSVTITGASSLMGNALAGVVAFETPVAMTGTEIDMTRLATRIVGEVTEVRAADGVHAVLTDATGLSIENVSLMGNQRAGLLLQLADGVLPASALSGITVDGSGEQYGAVAQGPGGLLPAGWDAGVTRTGATGANDSALSEILEVLGLIAPMYVPRDDP